MGLTIHLYVSPRLDPDLWASVWDESTCILDSFPVPLIRWTTERSPFGRRNVLSTRLYDLDQDGQRRQWTVCGDLTSGRMAEWFTLPRTLGSGHCAPGSEADESGDPLALPESAANASNASPSSGDWEFHEFGGRDLFGAKTQGFPFHYAVLAVAMLVESRFPTQALARGDFNLASCQLVKQWLDELLERPVDLPACVDPARLWNRLEGVIGNPEWLPRRFRATFQGSGSREARWLFQHSRETALDIYARELASYSTMNQMGASGIIQHVLEATQDLDSVFELVDRRLQVDGGSTADQFELEDLLGLLCRHHVTTSRFEDELLRDFTRFMEADANIEETIGRVFFRMCGVPSRFDFSISSQELVDAFARRSPNQRGKFAALVAEIEQVNQKELKQLSELAEACRKASTRDMEGFDEVKLDQFEDWLRFEATRHQKKLVDFEESASAFAKVAYQAIETDSGKKILPPEMTSAELLARMSTMLYKYGLGFPQKTWTALEEQTDVVTLRMLMSMATILGTTESAASLVAKIFREPECWPRLREAVLDRP